MTVCDELALHDARGSANRTGPLAGMAVAVKDNVDVADVRCTFGSRMFANRVPERDAETVRLLRAAGAVVVGKTALHEFAYGATTDSSHFGPCRNPWDLTRSAGGSSGGSGAALAADLCVGALGSDTGGSVRIPAALNGVSGLRPTLGSVSNRGSFPVSASLDTIGPMARRVQDVGALLRVIAGYDRQDPRAVEHPFRDSLETFDPGVEGVRIAMVGGFYADDIDPAVARAVRAAADRFAEMGADVSEVTAPGAAGALEAATVIVRAEALAVHAERLRTQPEMFGEDVRRRLGLGEAIKGTDLAVAIERMYEWRRDLRIMFDEVDLLLTPATAIPAPPLDKADSLETTSRLTRLTWPWSVAGLPALALPCGLSDEGLPVGLQLAAAPWRDGLLLRAGDAYQRVTDWHARRPPHV